MIDFGGILFGIVLLIVFCLSGMPIFAAIGLSGVMGAIFLAGTTPLLNGGMFIWKSLNTIGLLALPGFIMMGYLFFEHGFGKQLFNFADKWFGQFRGGLLYASTMLGALFGFICGSGLAGLVTVSSVTFPEAEKRHYDRKLVLATLSVAGPLASLIPPSLLMIIYASLAGVPLGQLMFAGILPGFLLAGLLMFYIFIRSKLDKKLCPAGQNYTMREKLVSTKEVVPVAIAFFTVLGGIYLGICSASEAAAVGALIAFLICVVYRRIRWATFKNSLNDTLKLCAMIYLIIVAAGFFNYFVFISGLDKALLAVIAGLTLPNWVIFIFLLILLTIMGCLFDVLVLVLVSVIVFLPVVTSIGYDPIWFGIMLIVACELAVITPPVGLNIYILQKMAPKGTTTANVISATLPCVAIIWVFFIILLIFPQIALWLPSLIK